MSIRVFHFSENDSIGHFDPRPVRNSTPRKPGFEWLNGPLVWAIDDWHQPLYLFPRDCPRILMWAKNNSSTEDITLYFKGSNARMVAYVEKRWLPKIQSESLHRYELPTDTFQHLDDAGMWVSKDAVEPINQTHVVDLPDRLRLANVELHALDTLTPLRKIWNSTLHVSGIRLRNAQDWRIS